MEEYYIVSFGSGELTPKSMGRIDTEVYKNGCEKIKNFVIQPQGGAVRRPGSYLKATITAGSRLVGFEGSDSIGYLLLINTTSIDVYREGTHVASATGTMSWTESQLEKLQFYQDGDKMYISVSGVKTRILTYTSGPSFAITDWTPTYNTPDTVWDNEDLSGASDVKNCASTITGYEGRLVAAASENNKNYIWATNVKKSDLFEESTPDIISSDALEINLRNIYGPKVKWMVGSRGLFIGTDHGIFSISNKDTPLSPLSTAMQNTSYPVSDIPGFLLGGELFFVQAGKRKIRLAVYDTNSDQYLTPEITIMAEHITYGGIKQIAVQYIPDTIIWVVKDNGELITFSYSQENKVAAWSSHTTEGNYKSIAVIREGSKDVVYTIVERDDNEYLEVFNDIEFDSKEYMFLDCAVTKVFGDVETIESITWTISEIIIDMTGHPYSDGEYIQIMDTGISDLDYNIFQIYNSGTDQFSIGEEYMGIYPELDDFGVVSEGTTQLASLTVTGLTHISNKDVYVTTGPVLVGEYTISDEGVLTLDKRRTEFTVGYNYYSDLIPMNLGIKKNTKKRIVSVGIEVLKTLGGKEGKDENNLDLFKYDKKLVMDVPQELITGTVMSTHRGGSSYNGDILIRQDLPLPMNILSLTINIEEKK